MSYPRATAVPESPRSPTGSSSTPSRKRPAELRYLAAGEREEGQDWEPDVEFLLDLGGALGLPRHVRPVGLQPRPQRLDAVLLACQVSVNS